MTLEIRPEMPPVGLMVWVGQTEIAAPIVSFGIVFETRGYTRAAAGKFGELLMPKVLI